MKRDLGHPHAGRQRRILARLRLALCVVVVGGTVALAGQDRQTFRSGVDLIQLDVSVLDRDRRPVRGLTAADFTLLEDGKPQRIVAFNAIDVPDPEPEVEAAAPWVREVASDVRRNTGPDGRLFTIVMDDALIPFEPWMINNAKAIARGVVDRMRPGDLASVIFTGSNQHAQDFTDDRRLLLRAIDRFRSWGGCAGCAFFPMNVLFHLTQSLAAAPQRRKSVIFIGTQLPLEGRGPHVKLEMYRRARFANVSIYPIDPSGSTMDSYLTANESRWLASERTAATVHQATIQRLERQRLMREQLQEVALNTGGKVVIDHNDAALALDGIFNENASYYVLGYETAKAGDRYRRIEVKVDRPGVTVRSRNMWRPEKPLKPDASPSLRAEHALSGVIPAADVPMRLTLAPFAAAGRPGATLALAIGVTETPPDARTAGKVNVAIGAFTPEGAHRASARQEATVTLTPGAGPSEIDLLAGVDLRPGRYSIRVGAHSEISGKGGSVYADVDVPDFARAPLSLSGVALSASPAPFAASPGQLAKLLPVVPTTRREFDRSHTVRAFLRVYQGGRTPLQPVSMTVTIVDAADAVLLAHEEALETGRFNRNRAADYQFPLPLAQLAPGEYLLALTARMGERSERRDVRFTVR
jgi:VWFA-related protein